ncbi:hypothetical protein [Neobacillus vireti]|uniref:hypothetical protein n=1 Tax=Neobacillus vireti TaxID=220686 RepID=UPI002FFDB638
MIMLELKLPVQAEQCIALLKRMPKRHPMMSTVEKDLKAWLKGYYGEQAAGYYLSFLLKMIIISIMDCD